MLAKQVFHHMTHMPSPDVCLSESNFQERKEGRKAGRKEKRRRFEERRREERRGEESDGKKQTFKP
jgi:hypothetical protein